MYFGGNLSTFLKYDLNSDAWYDVSKGVSHNAYDLYAFSNDTVISVTSLSASTDYVLKTTNNGATWTEPATAPQDRTLTGVDFYGSTGILISAANATLNKLFRSTDNGNTWSTINPIGFGLNAMQAISFASANTVYVVGDNQSATEGKLWKSIDGGILWADYSAYLPSNCGPLRSVRFLDNNIGWAGSDFGKIYYTLDGGLSWTEVTAISGSNRVNDIFLMQV